MAWIRSGIAHLRTHFENPARVRIRLPRDDEQPRVRWSPHNGFLYPDGTPQVPAELRAGRFTFFGATRAIGWPPDWTQAGAPRLWRAKLHEHGFLYALDFAEARGLVEDYIERHGPAKGAVGWEPHSLSLRLTAWVALFFGRWRAETRADTGFSARVWLELRRMLRWLEGHLETLADHRLENAVALGMAGACFEGDRADRWRRHGVRLLREQLDRQVLADGGNVERCPMAQQRLLYTLGLVLSTSDDELATECRGAAARVSGWLRAMTHPGGELALFHDATAGIYPETEVLLDWLAALGVTPVLACEHGDGWATLQPSGYFTAHGSAGDAFFMDAGQAEPLTPRARASALGIELSLGGHRFIVDEGSESVFADAERRPAGVARRLDSATTTPTRHDRRLDGAHVYSAGRPHPGNAIEAAAPTREATWTETGILHLRDLLRGDPGRAYTSQLRVDGGWKLETVARDRLRFTRDDMDVWVVASTPIDVTRSRGPARHRDELRAYVLRQNAVSAKRGAALTWTVCQARRMAEAELLFGRRAHEFARQE